jgi:hypothetical protein
MRVHVDLRQRLCGTHGHVWESLIQRKWAACQKQGPPIGRPLGVNFAEVYLAFMRESISSILAFRSALTCCKVARSPMNFM